MDSLEILGPGQELTRQPPPELLGFCDGFLVEFLIFLETCGTGVSARCDVETNRPGAPRLGTRRTAAGYSAGGGVVSYCSSEVCSGALSQTWLAPMLPFVQVLCVCAPRQGHNTLAHDMDPNLLSSIFWGGSVGSRQESPSVSFTVYTPGRDKNSRKVSTAWASATTGALGDCSPMMVVLVLVMAG